MLKIELWFLALLFTIQFGNGQKSGAAGPVSYWVTASGDSISLDKEEEIVFKFIWPDSLGQMEIIPVEDWTLDNLVEGSSGSRSFLETDSVKNISTRTLEFHYLYRGINPGPASVKNIIFILSRKDNAKRDTIHIGAVRLMIAPPEANNSENKLGWVVVLLFFIINILVLFIFAYKRKSQ